MQTYLIALVPSELKGLELQSEFMTKFLNNPKLASEIISLYYKIKKNTQMRFEGKNSFYPINPPYNMSKPIHINCGLSAYLQSAISKDNKYFGLVVRMAGNYLYSFKTMYRKRMLGLYPQNCGVKYPKCHVNYNKV